MAEFVTFIAGHWLLHMLRVAVVTTVAMFAIAYGVGRLQSWRRSYALAHWPEVSGRVEKAQWDYLGQESSTVAEIWYSYEVNGKRYGQVLEQELVDSDQATNHVIAMREKEVRVRYCPDKPQDSFVSIVL